MKNSLFLAFVLFTLISYAQPNTEVYLLDITESNGNIELTNLRNISNNEGYDNQPSFYDDNSVLFSSTKNGQTDIAKYDISSKAISWINNTPGGSEYSPLRIPNSADISAVRLDTSGLQRLYGYDHGTGNSEVIRKDAKVGYQVWYSEDILVTTILVENRMDLVVSNLKTNSSKTVQKNVGRSLHKIPNSELVSFIAKKADTLLIKSLHPITGVTENISNLPKETDDMLWLPDGSLLIPARNLMYKFKPESEEGIEILNLPEQNEINKISRMALSPDGKHLALVSNGHPSKIVQKQVDSYNARDIDAFVNCYAEDVVVRNFPADTMYVGQAAMRKNYSGLSPETKGYNVEVVNRITFGNKVIDHEKVTGKGKVQIQVAIYEVNNGKISSMNFIFDDQTAPDPEAIVKEQIAAYNKRDIDGFVNTYTEDVQLFDFPAELSSTGHEEIREGYTDYFENTPDLNCEIKNSIVIGNTVIIEEYITSNGNNFSAVLVYEVENGKISKVTFL